MTEIINDIYSAHLTRPSIVTIGSFDGVHQGHQDLINSVIARAHQRNAASVVVTLHPHPKSVLRPNSSFQLLTTLEERIELLKRLDMDDIVIFPFTLEASKISAREFVRLLVDHLHMIELECGPNFALGHNREGNIPFLRELGKEFGFDVTVVPPRQYDAGMISSTHVRSLVAAGEVTAATRLLRHFPFVSGIVVHGDHRGRTLGYPTANLDLNGTPKLIPANGIYAVWVRLGNAWFKGAANIGVRPQFGGTTRLVEVYILDFDRDIYGETLEAHFVERLRDEEKFDSVEELISQIGRDVENARTVLTEVPPPNDPHVSS